MQVRKLSAGRKADCRLSLDYQDGRASERGGNTGRYDRHRRINNHGHSGRQPARTTWGRKKSREVLSRTVGILENRENSGGEQGMDTGFNNLNSIIHGLHAKTLVIVAATFQEWGKPRLP